MHSDKECYRHDKSTECAQAVSSSVAAAAEKVCPKGAGGAVVASLAAGQAGLVGWDVKLGGIAGGDEHCGGRRRGGWGA